MRSWVFLFIGIVLITNVVTVHACVSSGSVWEVFLPDAVGITDAIVVGSFVEFDDANTNGILKVTTYLKGQGAEYVTIAGTDPRMLYNDEKVHRNYGCGMGYTRSSEVGVEGNYIVFLNKLTTGAFYSRGGYYFDDLNSAASIRFWFPEVDLSIEEMTRQISDEVGLIPQFPNVDLPYPRTAPISLTTLSGAHYMIPVDSNVPSLIPDEEIAKWQRTQHTCYAPCVAWSPNTIDKAYLYLSEEDMTERKYLEDHYTTVENFVFGRRISFSASSETYVLWTESAIQLFMLWYPYLNVSYDVDQQSYTPYLVNQILAQDSLNFPVAWSDDGFTLAFSTSEGLWLWDVFSVGYPPQLLIPASETIPTIRYFSPQGHYIAVSEGDYHYTLDLTTKHQLPDGIVSPDDRKLLAFDTVTGKPSSFQVVFLAPEQPLSEPNLVRKITKAQWIDKERFVVVLLDNTYVMWAYDPEVYPDGWQFRVDKQYLNVAEFNGIETIPDTFVERPHMRDFAYEPHSGLLRLGIDGYWLQVNYGEPTYLRDYLDAPIAEIAWLPSVFYYD